MLDDAQLFREACFIGGDWIDTADRWIDVDDPATGAVIGRVPQLGATQAQAAIDAAERAMPAWAARTAVHHASSPTGCSPTAAAACRISLWSCTAASPSSAVADVSCASRG